MVLLSAAVVSFTSTLASAEPRVESFVVAVGGQSSCIIFRSPDPVLYFFRGQGVIVPMGGITECDIAGEMRLTTDPNGPLSDSTLVDTIFNHGDNQVTGSTSTNAQFGKVAAEAHGTFTGPSNGGTVAGAEGYGLFKDSFTFDSPSISAGSSGSVLLYFTVAGNLSAPQPGTAGVVANYQQDTGAIFPIMNAAVDPRFPPGFWPPSVKGFTVTPTSISGSGVFHTFSLPITYGMPFDFTMGLLAFSVPGGGPIDADFTMGAQLTGIEAFDWLGQPVTDFVITSGSGTGYDANGVQLP
jgi:hypothetical protein